LKQSQFLFNHQHQQQQASGQHNADNAAQAKLPKVLITSSLLKADPRNITLDQLNPIEVARQITILEFSIFEKITPEELLSLGWMTDSKEWVAPNITQIISKSNSITEWVTQCILKTENAKQRRNILRQFIGICDACLEMNNYNTLFEIMMSLTSQPVYRLKQTWESLSKPEMAKFKKFDQVTSYAGNRKVYRDTIKEIMQSAQTKPLLPYIGVHLTDLVFFDQGNPSQKQENDIVLINFTKRSLMADVVQLMKSCQKTSYQLERVETIQQFLHAQFQVVPMPEEEMYRRSKELEK